MPGLSANGLDLELEEHPRFEHGWRRLQTILFSLFGLLVIAALAGLLGSGPLAKRTFAIPGTAFTLQFPKFARARAPETLAIEARGAPGGAVPVHIDMPLAQAIDIDSFAPLPVGSGVDATGVTYLFALAPGATGRIEIKAKPATAGIARGTITIDGHAQPVSQIVWP